MAFLIGRGTALACCTFGVLEVMIGTILTICGFIQMGVFYNTSAIGLWAGFPLLVPGLLGIVVLATRHKVSAFFFTGCNVVVLVLCVAHAVVAWDDTDFWETFSSRVDNNQCYERVDQCICTFAQSKYHVQRCDLYHFGFELYWCLVAFSIAGGVLAIIGVLLGAIASCQQGQKEDYEDPPRDHRYDHKPRQDYYVNN